MTTSSNTNRLPLAGSATSGTASAESAVPRWAPLAYVLLLAVLYWPSLQEAMVKWRPNTEYEHVFLVFPAMAYLIWRQRPNLIAVPKSVDRRGLPLLICGCAIQVAAYLFRIKYVGGWTFILSLAGAILLAYGPGVWRLLSFVTLLIVTTDPIPNTVMSSLTLHLQTITTIMAEKVVYYLGYPVVRDGNVLSVPGVNIEVAEACSGLHKSLAFLSFAALFGYMLGLRPFGRIILLLMAIPVAMIVNVIRVASLIAITAAWGDNAFKIAHEPSDFVAVGLGFLAFLGISNVLQWQSRQRTSPE